MVLLVLLLVLSILQEAVAAVQMQHLAQAAERVAEPEVHGD